MLALAAGFAEARSRAVALDAGELVTGVDIVLTAGTYVFGKVTDQHGAPVIGAEIAAQPEVGAPLEGFTDADGTYGSVRSAAQIELRATAYGHVEARRKLELAPPKGATAGRAARGPRARGRRRDPRGHARRCDRRCRSAARSSRSIGGAGEGRRGTVAPDGTFTLDMLPRGHVRVRVTACRLSDRRARRGRPRAPASACACARARRRRRRRAARCRERCAARRLDDDRDGPGGATAEASTDKAGHWKLGPLAPATGRLDVRAAGLPAADARASTCPGARARRDDGARRPHRSRARRAVGGTVRDGRGQRVAGAHIVIRRRATGRVEGDTDAQGEFRLHDCPTGELVVSATQGDLGGRPRDRRAGDEVLGLALELR